jgi:DNA-binding NarL/FixJ family response regulator
MTTSHPHGRTARVLLAEDHERMLVAVSHLLSTSFHVVSAVTNGQDAVDAASRLDPDVIVLDVSMPELDGFQTVDRLRTAGSRAPVVFLSTYDTDAYVTAALRAGVRAYVPKARMAPDLIAAIHHALAGRIVVPSLATLPATTSGGAHAAHFHQDDRRMLDAASRFVVARLHDGEPVVVVGTERTRLAIATHLESRGIDVQPLKRRGQYMESDAGEALASVMRGNQPDHDRLAATVDGLERWRLAYANGRSRLVVFGEMAGPLCRMGMFDAALDIERTWSELTAQLQIFTVCSYPIACWRTERAEEPFARLCAEHHALGSTMH